LIKPFQITAQLLSTKTGFRFVCHATIYSSTKEVIVPNPSKFLFATENLSSKEKLAPEALSSY
jgi:hypothetical protein